MISLFTEFDMLHPRSHPLQLLSLFPPLLKSIHSTAHFLSNFCLSGASWCEPPSSSAQVSAVLSKFSLAQITHLIRLSFSATGWQWLPNALKKNLNIAIQGLTSAPMQPHRTQHLPFLSMSSDSALSFSKPRSLLPWGLCTYYSLCLKHSSHFQDSLRWS